MRADARGPYLPQTRGEVVFAGLESAAQAKTNFHGLTGIGRRTLQKVPMASNLAHPKHRQGGAQSRLPRADRCRERQPYRLKRDRQWSGMLPTMRNLDGGITKALIRRAQCQKALMAIRPRELSLIHF
jgi:hypothetical protein